MPDADGEKSYKTWNLLLATKKKFTEKGGRVHLMRTYRFLSQRRNIRGIVLVAESLRQAANHVETAAVYDIIRGIVRSRCYQYQREVSLSTTSS